MVTVQHEAFLATDSQILICKLKQAGKKSQKLHRLGSMVRSKAANLHSVICVIISVIKKDKLIICESVADE